MIVTSFFTQVFLPLAVVLIMFALGATLNLADFRRVLRLPRGLVLGLVAHTLLLPLLAFAVAAALRLPAAVAVGLILIASCPANASVNIFTHLARGDTMLSVLLTAGASLACVFTVPLFVNAGLYFFPAGHAGIALPILPAAFALFAVSTLPVLAGMRFRRWRPRIAHAIEARLGAFGLVMVVLVVTGAVWNAKSDVMSALLIAGTPALILNAAAVGVAWGLASAMRLPRGQRIAIALECGLQNFALAAFVSLTLLNDAVLLLPAVAYGLTMWLSAVAVVILARRGEPIADAAPSFDFHAAILKNVRRRPNAIAAVDGGREITYARFAKDIDAVSRRLQALDLPEKGRVAIYVTQPYLHWLVVIGLWRIRITSVSVSLDVLGELSTFFAARVLISDQEGSASTDVRFVLIGEAWLHDDGNLPPLREAREFEKDHPVRIVLSSGTTGMPKKIPLTKDVIDARMFRALNNPLLNPSVRFMSLVNVASVEFFFSVAAWSAGGTVEFSGEPLHATLSRGKLKCNFIFMNTAQLNEAVHALPASSEPIPSLMVLVGGSILPRPVYLKAQQRLTRSVMLIYGSAEAGTVALNPDPLQICNPGVCGYVVSDMEVQVVDEAGLSVPRGAEGEIRIRGTSCIDHYLDDPAASRKTFRDGWFYPGDTGTLSRSGLMTIVGRVDDLINVACWKVAPSVIEQELYSCRGVKDVVAFSMPDEDDVQKLWIAVVRVEGFSHDDLVATWVGKFGADKELNIIYVDAIPRNAMGKALRNDLRAVTKAQLSSLPDSSGKPAAIPDAEAPKAVSKPGPLQEGGLTAPRMEISMKTITIDDQHYSLDQLSDEAKSQIENLQFVDAELQRLTAQIAVYQTARASYWKALSKLLPDTSAGARLQ